MHCLFLVPRIDKASTRYRIVQYLPSLAEQGISHSIIELSIKSRNWIELVREIVRSDVVFVQKKIFPVCELWLIRRLAKKIIFDIDDSVMFKDGHACEASQRRQIKRFSRMARNSDFIICGNAYLAANTELYNSNLRILPTPIDMDRYIRKTYSQSDDGGVTIGWIGSGVTLKYLKDIAFALAEIAARYPGTKLKIVADEFFDIEGMEVIKQPWTYKNEIADLHSFDIGLMPLTDDVWTRGKCGFKLLQCMAVGLPVVCSPVGINRDIVSEGVEGFFAKTPDEWIEKLSFLIENRGIREAMGNKGRKKVVQKYSTSVNVSSFLDLLKKISC